MKILLNLIYILFLFPVNSVICQLDLPDHTGNEAEIYIKGNGNYLATIENRFAMNTGGGWIENAYLDSAECILLN